MLVAGLLLCGGGGGGLGLCLLLGSSCAGLVVVSRVNMVVVDGGGGRKGVVVPGCRSTGEKKSWKWLGVGDGRPLISFHTSSIGFIEKSGGGG